MGFWIVRESARLEVLPSMFLCSLIPLTTAAGTCFLFAQMKRSGLETGTTELLSYFVHLRIQCSVWAITVILLVE